MDIKKPKIEELIARLDLQPLPVEGGLFVQTYCSAESIPAVALPERYPPNERIFGTAILFLLTPDPDSFSALHWLPTDEVYHFYLGDPVEMLQLYPDGSSERILLGQDILSGQRVQYMAPRDVIQGSHLLPGGEFALIGTTMAPGFLESDYHGCEREELIQKYPREADLIRMLTRPGSPLKME
jgi:predicted cupin superfamily sugar epimerase